MQSRIVRFQTNLQQPSLAGVASLALQRQESVDIFISAYLLWVPSSCLYQSLSVCKQRTAFALGWAVLSLEEANTISLFRLPSSSLEHFRSFPPRLSLSLQLCWIEMHPHMFVTYITSYTACSLYEHNAPTADHTDQVVHRSLKLPNLFAW